MNMSPPMRYSGRYVARLFPDEARTVNLSPMQAVVLAHDTGHAEAGEGRKVAVREVPRGQGGR